MVVLAVGRAVIPGAAEGLVLRSSRPLSLWGGIDPQTGHIIDRRHDRCGESAVGRVLAIPSEKGSSTGSAVLLELARIGKAPAAIITCEPAPIVALGAIVAQELYGIAVPIMLLSCTDYDLLADGSHIWIACDGTIKSDSPAT